MVAAKHIWIPLALLFATMSTILVVKLEKSVVRGTVYNSSLSQGSKLMKPSLEKLNNLYSSVKPTGILTAQQGWQTLKSSSKHGPKEVKVVQGPDGSLWETIIQTVVHRHHLRRRISPSRRPSMCNCRLSNRRRSGFCYFYTRPGHRFCKKRYCTPKYICVSKKTGITCILKKIRTKIVPIDAYGKCRTAKYKSYMYVPYSWWEVVALPWSCRSSWCRAACIA